jgi:hypothetical protein
MLTVRTVSEPDMAMIRRINNCLIKHNFFVTLQIVTQSEQGFLPRDLLLSLLRLFVVGDGCRQSADAIAVGIGDGLEVLGNIFQIPCGLGIR